MEWRNKIFAMLLALLLFSFSPVYAFASEIENPAPISITSGLVFDEDGQDATFDSSRMVYGEAVPYSQISVTICGKDGDGDMQEEYSEDLEVGSLGIFSMSLPLELGTNYIELTVNCQNFDEAIYHFEVKRKPLKVKDELKSMVALPGSIKNIK
ncbi:hypothetical protein [Anaerotignum sp. MB30-C6]|uniref:hypothetical protein n=1 Tax=Anaerotignum sp. MB30-C6 TaxID=3070814 RepID=UPI0027DB1C1A|nr:hypothetical protein [Anaerotignum sp. MB30-C6]WMI81469.1 hypothetical protein RBQ60_01680 [Anaerotignum sp. MB30-C6]